jgi:hypothetical protein
VSGIRWTTGVGIAVGGLSGALLALLGLAKPHVAASPTVMVTASAASSASAASTTAAALPAPSVAEGASATPEAPAEPPPSASGASSATPPSASPVAAASASPVASASSVSAPALELPTTREALLRAELYCDKRQDFDECGRAAAALEAGSAGPVDAEQAKRFRRIALTHLVAQCEAGSAHACFVMAAKYRAGTELASSPARAEALEKRGLELCRLGHSAPECPASSQD